MRYLGSLAEGARRFSTTMAHARVAVAATPPVPSARVQLKDGSKATVRALTESDLADVEQFYRDLPEYSHIRRQRCQDRNAGVDHAEEITKLCWAAARGEKNYRGLIVRADAPGHPVIGCTLTQLDHYSKTAYPGQTAVAQSHCRNAVATHMKQAQLLAARDEGMQRMWVAAPTEAMMKVYEKATAALGLHCAAHVATPGSWFPNTVEVDLLTRDA